MSVKLRCIKSVKNCFTKGEVYIFDCNPLGVEGVTATIETDDEGYHHEVYNDLSEDGFMWCDKHFELVEERESTVKTIAGFDEEQQREITQWLIDGATQQEIANELGTSRGTIKRINQQMRPVMLAEEDEKYLEKCLEDCPEDNTCTDQGCPHHYDTAEGNNTYDPSCFTLVPNSIINISHNNEIYTANHTHPRFSEIVQLCIEDNFDLAVEMVDVSKAITKYSDGDIAIEGNTVLYRGSQVNDGLATKILELMKEGDEGFKRYVKFMANLRLNPSFRAVKELFGFISHSDIGIDDDGYLLAWKFVNTDYTDWKTGSVQNYIGNTIRMERNMVNENKDETCSQGLHVCVWDYKFTGTAVRVRLHPKDVVSIPSDYQDKKMRCSEYEILYAVDEDKEFFEVSDKYEDNKIITVGEMGKILDVQ